MALRYDRLIPGSFTADIEFWPRFVKAFDPGVLSNLYGRLNTEDSFDECRLRANLGASFIGEEWTFSIHQGGLTIHGHSQVDQFRERGRALLRATKEHLEIRAMVTDEIRADAVIPDDKKRDVGAVVKRQLLTRVKAEHYARLPGEVEGAGLRLVGFAHDYEWHATVASSLESRDDLYISAELDFYYPEKPPVRDDLNLFDDWVRITNEFLQGNVSEFARSLLK